MRAAIAVLVLALAAACGSATSGNNDAGAPDCNGRCLEDELCINERCVPLSCGDFRQNGNETDIDCGGDCTACSEGQACLSFRDCSTRFCDGDACRDCTADVNCAAAGEVYCADGSCVDRRGNGLECSGPNECISGYCADGVCCDGPCDGECQTCGTDGTCDYVESGGPSGGDCPEDVGGCGLSGACDGFGGCLLKSNAASCDLNICGSSGAGLGTCNGQGQCDGDGSCNPYACGGESCLTDCDDDGDCANGYYCSSPPSGSCVAKKTQGSPCDGANECINGFCADGVCCTSACTGTCKRCDGSNTGSAAGTCDDINAGVASPEDCTDQGAESCGQTGACNGNGACEEYDTSTVCSPATCSNAQETEEITCNGSGSCPGGLTASCNGYTCNSGGTACRDQCSEDGHCLDTYYCNGSSCVVDEGIGEGCSGDSQCASGFCTGGSCCHTDACVEICDNGVSDDDDHTVDEGCPDDPYY